MRARRRFFVAMLSVFILVVAACGNEGDDDDDASSATTQGDTEQTSDGATDTTAASGDQFADLVRIEEPDPCTNDPGVTDTEIKVGVIAITSGPQATSFGPAVDGIKARVEKANTEGELGGRTITLVERDDTGDQTRNGEVARDLVEQENVFGIIEDSSASVGSAEYLYDEGIPVAGWHVGVPEWGKFANFFAFRQATAENPDEVYTTRNVDLIEELGGTKVALIGGQNASSALFIDRAKKAVEKMGTVELAYEKSSVPLDQRDFTSEAQEIKDSGADALLTGMDFLQNAGLSDALNKAGVAMNATIFPGGYDPRITALPGVDGAVFGLEFIPFEISTPAFTEFDKWAPPEVVRGQVPYAGWLSAEMFIEGLKQAGLGCPTREAFVTNLRLVDDYTANGAFDAVDLSEGFGEDFLCAYYVTVEGGKFVPLFEGEQFCGEKLEI